MSVSDVFITDAEQSDLKPMNDMEGMLHHPYQSLRSLPGSNRMDVRIVSFNNPGFGQRNEVQIPSMDLIPHEMYVELNVGALAGTADPAWSPTPTWLTQQGVDLNFKEVSIYNMSEAECLASTILDEEDNYWTKKQDSYGFNQLTSGGGGGASAQKLYLPVNIICTQVLSKIGPLSAYASNDWSLSVDLRPLAAIARGSDATAATGGALNNMRLIILGSKAPAGEVALTREALMKNGIVFNFLRSNYIRRTIADDATSDSAVYSSVVGAVSHLRLLLRKKTGWDSETPNAVNNINYDVLNGVNDLISAGKTSNPFEIWGQQISQKFVRNFFSAKSLYGASRYLSTAATVETVDTGIFDVAFAESKGDIEFGISTGSYPVKNDLQVDLAMAAVSGADYLDAVIYTHVRGVITAGLANVNLSA